MGGWSDPTSSSFLGGHGNLGDPANVFGRSNGKGGGGAPAAPDFAEMARIQAESSRANTQAQTQANRPNQSNDFGYSEWTQDANGNWTQRSGLNGPLAGAAQGLQSQVADNTGKPILTGDAARQQAIDAAYSQSSRMLDPQFQQREDAMRAQLAAQGLDPTSEAYQASAGNLGRERMNAYGDARDRAIEQGTAAGQAVFNQNLAAREAPLSELGMLKGLGAPQDFKAAGVAQPDQSLEAAMQQYASALQSYGIQQQGKNSKMSGGAGAAGAIGAAAIMA